MSTRKTTVQIDTWDFIPLPFLAHLKWQEGDTLEIELVNDCLLITKLKGSNDS